MIWASPSPTSSGRRGCSNRGPGPQVVKRALQDHTDPKLVHFEIDTYWVEKGGLDAAKFLQRHAGRVFLLHAKELRKSDGADVPATT